MGRAVPETASDAFAWADETRRARGELLAVVESGACGMAEALRTAARDDLTADVRVVSIVEKVPGVGKVAARRALRSAGIEEHFAAGALSEDQIESLADVLT